MALIDKNSDKFDEGTYLEMCSGMQTLYDQLFNKKPTQVDDEELVEALMNVRPRLNVYAGIDFMEEVSRYVLDNPQLCEKFIRENKEIKRMNDKRRKEAVYWYCYMHNGNPWENMNWLDLERQVGHEIHDLNSSVHLAYKEFYNNQIKRVREKLETFNN